VTKCFTNWSETCHSIFSLTDLALTSTEIWRVKERNLCNPIPQQASGWMEIILSTVQQLIIVCNGIIRNFKWLELFKIIPLHIIQFINFASTWSWASLMLFSGNVNIRSLYYWDSYYASWLIHLWRWGHEVLNWHGPLLMTNTIGPSNNEGSWDASISSGLENLTTRNCCLHCQGPGSKTLFDSACPYSTWF